MRIRRCHYRICTSYSKRQTYPLPTPRTPLFFLSCLSLSSLALLTRRPSYPHATVTAAVVPHWGANAVTATVTVAVTVALL